MRKDLIFLSASFASAAFGVMNRNKSEKSLYSPLNISELKLPILIISPHPDDEWLSSAGLIREVSNRGLSSKIDVMVISNGEAFGRINQKWKKYSIIPISDERKLETINELSFLMGRSAKPSFIGFRDGTIADAFRNKDKKNLLSSYNIFKDLISKKNYGTYIYPIIFDDHPDHWGTSLYTLLALFSLSLEHKIEGINNKYLMYLIHFPNFPIKGSSKKSRIIFPSLINSNDCLEFNLSLENFVAKKISLKFLSSQNIDFRNSIMLRNFIKRNEPYVNLTFRESHGMCNIIKFDKKSSSEELFNYNFIFSNDGKLKLIDFEGNYSNHNNSLSITFTKIGNCIKVREIYLVKD